MIIKLTKDSIGKSYKTRKGTRAVVVQYDGLVGVYHYSDGLVRYHYDDGTIDSEQFKTHLDLISEWKEPLSVSVRVYANFEDGNILVCVPDGYRVIRFYPDAEKHPPWKEITITEVDQ